MISFEPIGTLLQAGPFRVTAWGLLAVIGFLFGLWMAVKEAKRKKLDVEKIYSIAIFSLLFALIVGRIGYILSFPEQFRTFLSLFALWNGGIIWHGAFLGGVLGAYLALSKEKWKAKLTYFDVLGIALPLGHSIGRISCIIADLHPGKLASAALPWALSRNGIPTHPVTIYEAIAEFILFITIFSQRKKKFFDGAFFSFYVAGYSFLRFWIDFFRTDPLYNGFTVAQWISLILFFIFGWIILKNLKKQKK